MTDPLARLRRARRLESEAAVEAFEQALADLPETLDPPTLDALHLVLDDDAVVPEVMHELVHRLERTPMGEYEGSVTRVLPELSASAPWWAETVVMRLLFVPGYTSRPHRARPLTANSRPNEDPLVTQRVVSCSKSGGDDRIRTGE